MLNFGNGITDTPAANSSFINNMHGVVPEKRCVLIIYDANYMLSKILR
jgi:hypothetical protein